MNNTSPILDAVAWPNIINNTMRDKFDTLPLFQTGILSNKTMDDELMYIPIYVNQNYTFSRFYHF